MTGGGRILLRTTMDAGHAGASGRCDGLRTSLVSTLLPSPASRDDFRMKLNQTGPVSPYLRSRICAKQLRVSLIEALPANPGESP